MTIYEHAYQIWLEYHNKCEDFDRTLPGHIQGRSWMPRPDFVKRSSRYAAKAHINALLKLGDVPLYISRRAKLDALEECERQHVSK